MRLKKHEVFSSETKESVRCGQHGYCKGCTEKIDEFHHMLHNTATYRKLFPLFLQSIFNCVGLCRACHLNKQRDFSVSEDMAREYEQALRMLMESVEVKTLLEVLSGGKTKKKQSYSGTNTTMPKVL